MSTSVTVVVCAAGLGTRLGLNLPKALVPVNGRAMIAHQLDLLDEVEDIVVVVGYRGQEVIDLVAEARPDAAFALNHEFATTGTAASLRRGSLVAGPQVLALDGDLLVDRADFYRFLDYPDEVLGVMAPRTKKPVYAHTEDNTLVLLSQSEPADLEWTGLSKISREAVLSFGSGHVFPDLNARLPLPFIHVDCLEIDDPEDLHSAEGWLRSKDGYLGGTS